MKVNDRIDHSAVVKTIINRDIRPRNLFFPLLNLLQTPFRLPLPLFGLPATLFGRLAPLRRTLWLLPVLLLPSLLILLLLFLPPALRLLLRRGLSPGLGPEPEISGNNE